MENTEKGNALPQDAITVASLISVNVNTLAMIITTILVLKHQKSNRPDQR